MFSCWNFIIGLFYYLIILGEYKMTSQGKCKNAQMLFQHFCIHIFAYFSSLKSHHNLKGRHYYYFQVTDERGSLCH